MQLKGRWSVVITTTNAQIKYIIKFGINAFKFTHIESYETLCFLWQTIEVTLCNWNMTEMRYNHLMYIIERYVWFLVNKPFCHF